MKVHFADTPEGEKVSQELDRCMEKRLAYEDEKMWRSIILGVLCLLAVFPFSTFSAWVIRGGNL